MSRRSRCGRAARVRGVRHRLRGRGTGRRTWVIPCGCRTCWGTCRIPSGSAPLPWAATRAATSMRPDRQHAGRGAVVSQPTRDSGTNLDRAAPIRARRDMPFTQVSHRVNRHAEPTGRVVHTSGMTLVSPTVEEHLAGLDAAVDRMAVWARSAGPEAPVPTCPGWAVRDLLAHQGMVHRWADRRRARRGPSRCRRRRPRGGGAGGRRPGRLAARRSRTPGRRPALPPPTTSAVMTFLKEAPPARAFWARRQCHETTVHALDALSALERRPLVADDVWLTDALAADGVDELLVGFWQRRTKGPRSESPYTATVVVTDGPAWSARHQRPEPGDPTARVRRRHPGWVRDRAAGRRPTSTWRCGTAVARSTTRPACSTRGASAARSAGEVTAEERLDPPPRILRRLRLRADVHDEAGHRGDVPGRVVRLVEERVPGVGVLLDVVLDPALGERRRRASTAAPRR